MAERLARLEAWLKEVLGSSDFEVTPASSDASFRRYFRVHHGSESFIAMDAPPTHEDTGPFVRVAELLARHGLNVPRVLARDAAQGLLLLSDLGDVHYLARLDAENADSLYADAMHALVRMQRIPPAELGEIPPYDETLLMREMALFRDWYLRRHRGLVLSSAQEQVLGGVYLQLTEAALAQPRVFVHRDYHSRNLMVLPQDNPGILDFQDAVHGPVTYDLVSLLRDCYIAWPRERVEAWALAYLQSAQQAGLLSALAAEQWLRWFDWMGVQRHLKVAGIFARLNHRDGKSGYLADIPRALGYVREVAQRYEELTPLLDFIPEGAA